MSTNFLSDFLALYIVIARAFVYIPPGIVTLCKKNVFSRIMKKF